MLKDSMQLVALESFPLVEPGDSLIDLLIDNLQHNKLELQNNDVLVIAQKIISKAENCYAYLNDVEPSSEAEKLAVEVDKDPRLVQLILDESKEVVRKRLGVMIVEHRLGYVHANAGIDRSNISSDEHNPRVLLLPKDSDKSAAELRSALKERLNLDIKIIINDSAGRAWRNGTLGFAIGTAGFEPIQDLIGNKDIFGKPLEVSTVAVADELAAAGSFLMGQAGESKPVVIIRNAKLPTKEVGSQSLIRDKSVDLFR